MGTFTEELSFGNYKVGIWDEPPSFRTILVRGRTWGDFAINAGWVESPDNTFTRDTAGSWTPRVTSNLSFTGAVRIEGSSGFVAATDVCFGLDPTPLVSQPFNTAYAWYLSPAPSTRLVGVTRVSPGAAVAGDTYGVRKYWDGSQWAVDWYRIRSGVTTVHDTVVLGSDVALSALAGAFQTGTYVSLTDLSD